MNEIKCPHCGKLIDIDDILVKDVEAKVLAEQHKKHEAELAKVREQAEQQANKALDAKLDIANKQREQDIELDRERIKAEFEGKAKKDSQGQELLIKRLEDDAASAKENNDNLREQLSKLMDELRAERKAKEDVELESKKKLAEEESKIRDEAKKTSDEEHSLKIKEMEKKLADTQKSLADAQRKAEQGSQQNQGEVLELILEDALKIEFPTDDIDEVKKGVNGADIIQTVKNQRLEKAGVLLWESKNAKWQPSWIAKFKEDIRNANANVGVIVSKELPDEYGDMRSIEPGVWVVKPKLALALASAMRAQILNVFIANNNSENKGEKMEVLYQYISSPEFRHRIESIVENYNSLQSEIEKEKRTANQRWARQEKSIRAVIDNTFGMYGDLQGITGGTMGEIKQLESGDEEDE